MAQKLFPTFYPSEQPAWNMRGSDPRRDWLTQIFKPGHEGQDHGLPVGTPFHGSGYGEVVDKQVGWIGGGGGGWGTHFVIRYDDVIFPSGKHFASIFIRTAHMDAHYLNIGDKVVLGQVFGTSGNTGSSSGPHMHIETRVGFVRGGARGALINPADVFWWPITADVPDIPNIPDNPGTPTIPEGEFDMGSMTVEDFQKNVKKAVSDILNDTVSPWEQDTRRYMGHTICEDEWFPPDGSRPGNKAIFFIETDENGQLVRTHVTDEHWFWVLVLARFLSTGPTYDPTIWVTGDTQESVNLRVDRFRSIPVRELLPSLDPVA